MREYVPRNKWESVLEIFIYTKQGLENAIESLYIKKFEYKIENREITILSPLPRWSWTTGTTRLTKFIIDDPHETAEYNPGKSKGYVGKPRHRNGKARRCHPPRIRKK